MKKCRAKRPMQYLKETLMTEVSLKKYMPPIFVRYNAAIPSLMTKEERRGGLMIGIVYKC